MNNKYFIINQVDRPDRDHVVMETSPGVYEYLSERLRNWGAMPRPSTAGMDSLEDFGFTIKENLKTGTVYFIKTRPSRVSCKSCNEIRPWQGSHEFELKMK